MSLGCVGWGLSARGSWWVVSGVMQCYESMVGLRNIVLVRHDDRYVDVTVTSEV